MFRILPFNVQDFFIDVTQKSITAAKVSDILIKII